MSVAVQADFFPGRRGRLFTVTFQPGRGDPCGVVVHVPAFAEEMNKARRQVALQARALAGRGWRVVIPDLFGTGDSEGEFQDADWALWCDDLCDLCETLSREHGRPVLWGLRAGVLLARAVLDRVAARGLVCWQPVPRGDQFLGQFLRLRLAASMLGGEARETMAELRQQLDRNGVLEVAGYGLSRGLAGALGVATLASPAEPLPTLWCEVAASAERGIGAASRRVLQDWQDAGMATHTEVVVGEPFWTTQEIHTIPALVETTASALQAWRGDS